MGERAEKMGRGGARAEKGGKEKGGGGVRG